MKLADLLDYMFGWLKRDADLTLKISSSTEKPTTQCPESVNIYSQYCVDLIKYFEGFRSQAYPDEGGVWTIGYGTTAGVKPGQTITEPEAEVCLMREMNESVVAIRKLVKVVLNQKQFDALVSMIYNIGIHAFARSTLLKLLNSGAHDMVPDEMQKWIYVQHRPNKVLKLRRALESSIFKGEDIPIP